MSPTASELRTELALSTLRARDLADGLGVPEAALVAAQVGHGATRIAADPGRLVPALETLGEVMALTRNDSCVIEKVGTYTDFHPGTHAAMTLNPEIDLRLFPRHWVHAFAVETPAEGGPKRSIQVFDAAGDAVHKVHLRATSDLAAWDALTQALAADDQSDTAEFQTRAAVDGPRFEPANVGALRAEWPTMTDTHQFLPLVKRHGMNRLGAYRIAGEPLVRALDPAALGTLIEGIAGTGLPMMVFVGNLGCIEIHSGPIETVKPMGPWLNIMDPRFNLHLRTDRVAEVWEVRKPGEEGVALSVEAFDARGELIVQLFGVRPSKGGVPAAWQARVAALPGLTERAA